MRDTLEQAGYDGIVIKTKSNYDEVVVFKPETSGVLGSRKISKATQEQIHDRAEMRIAQQQKTIDRFMKLAEKQPLKPAQQAAVDIRRTNIQKFKDHIAKLLKDETGAVGRDIRKPKKGTPEIITWYYNSMRPDRD